jgi:hypothetical protein
MKRSLLLISILGAGLGAGCGGSSNVCHGDGCGSSGGGGSGGGGGVAGGIAVVDSDYTSTAVSLISPTSATLAKDDCLDSGAISSTLSLALSSDVVLASSPQPNGELLLIDRLNGALDYLTTTTCTVLRQMSIGAFYGNPHDVVSLSATKAYVTLNEPNKLGGTAAGNDEGDDILIIDPTAETILGHIDLSAYAPTSASATILPRPDRALLIDGKVYVTLDDNSQDFATTADGRIVIIDPTTDSVSGTIDLTGYKSCSGLDYLASSKTLLVGCSGDYLETLPNQLAQSALVLIDLGGATPAIARTIPASALGGRSINFGNFVFAGDNLLIASTYGDLQTNSPPDQLWAVTIDAASAVKLADGDAAGVFSSTLWLPDAKQVLATDGSATTPLVRVYDVANPAAVTQTSTFDANPKSGLPPRLLGRY